jgi:tetratricopeptide (TPR) repeat protein
MLTSSLCRGQIDNNKDLIDLLIQSGTQCYFEGQYKEATELLSIIDTCESSPAIKFYLGMSYLALNDVRNGLPSLRSAVDEDPSNNGYRFQYARVLNQSGLTDAAKHEYETLIESDSLFTPAFYQLGLVAIDQKQFDVAIARLRRVIALNPVDYLSYFHLGSAYIRLDQKDSAQTYLSASVSLNPNYVPSKSLLASLYFTANNYPEALRLYSDLSSRQPGDAELYYKAGLCFSKLDQIDSAITCYRKATAADTSNDLYFAQLGYSYLMVEQFDSAIAAYGRAIEIEKDNSLYYINLGFAFTKIDSTSKAIDEYQNAVAACHPENISSIYIRLGTLYYYQKRYREALASYQQALDLQPLNKEAQFYVASTYDLLSNPKSAARQYQKYLKLAKDDTTKLQRERKQQAKARLRYLTN